VYRTSTGRLGGVDLELQNFEELLSFIASIKSEVRIIQPLREGDLWELMIYDEEDEAQG